MIMNKFKYYDSRFFYSHLSKSFYDVYRIDRFYINFQLNIFIKMFGSYRYYIPLLIRSKDRLR